MTTTIFAEYLGEIYVFYGLSFVLLGYSALLHPGDSEDLPISRHFWLLGVFGLLHGGKELLDAWMITTNGAGARVELLGTSLLITSYVALFEFARRAATDYGHEHAVNWEPLTSAWIYIPVALGVLLLAGIATDRAAGLSAGARYLLGFPGAVLAGLMLYGAFDARNAMTRVLGVAFVAFGFLGGLIAAHVVGFPAWLPTQTTFLEATGIPVQIFRAICALAAMLSLAALVRGDARSAAAHAREKAVAIQDLASSLERRFKESIADLRKSESRLRLATQSAQLGTWDWDIASDTLVWDERMYELYGVRRDEFSDPYESWEQGVHPDDLARVEAEVEAAVAGTKNLDTDFRVVYPDGTIHHIESHGLLQRATDGKALRIIGVNWDTTERKVAEEALRESERQLRKSQDLQVRFLEAMPDALITVNQQGEIVYVNAQAERAFGYTKEEMIGQLIEMLMPEDARLAHVTHRSSYFQNPTVRTMGAGLEFSGLRKDGTSFFAEISLSPLEIDGEQFVAAAVHDITQRKAMKEQLRQAQKMQVVGQLTGGIAHDFNNLLTIIIGNLQLLEESSSQDQAVHVHTREALDAALRGAELTRRLLAFSRKQLLVPKVIDMNELVTELDPLFRRTLGEDISVRTELAGDLWLTPVDPSQLENALINLAVNARDAMPDGGKLTIETSNTFLDEDYASSHAEVSPGEYVLLKVSDNGTGIPKDVLAQVFEPFFSTKEVGKGTGLGLSMVYGFVKQSNGHITIYSEKGHGTTITIYLPKSQSATEKTGITSTKLGRIPSGSETILLVEDEAGVRKIGVALLTGLGYRVIEAGTGPEALALLDQHDDIDLLFTDMVMPGGMTGAELARHGRERKPKLKVLYTSGYTDTAIFENGLLQHGDDMLNKPYQKKALAQKVRDVLDQG